MKDRHEPRKMVSKSMYSQMSILIELTLSLNVIIDIIEVINNNLKKIFNLQIVMQCFLEFLKNVALDQLLTTLRREWTSLTAVQSSQLVEQKKTVLLCIACIPIRG